MLDNQKQNLPDKKVSPTALSNRVDYLLAQVSQVDRRAALERKRQEASVKHKMTQYVAISTLAGFISLLDIGAPRTIFL